MNVLVLGSGKGSFEVRGRQLGAALGAIVSSRPDRLQWADVVVLIKRADPAWAELARRAGKAVVWDALDFWQQPEHNAASEAEALALLTAEVARYQSDLVIGATQAMAAACGGAYLPHHSRPNLTTGPVRDYVGVVAYEGTRKYLGQWGKAAERACAVRGWRFVVNPPDLRDADIVLALRDGEHDGSICREWKSGVKLVNAIASGRPVVSQDSAAWREIAPDGTLVQDVSDLDGAFEAWTDREARSRVARGSALRAAEFALPTIAGRYRDLLFRVHLGLAA